MYYIFEMANNHQGNVNHAKTIIDKFSDLSIDKNINAAIKFQFRQLDTFIHDDYKNSDLKFVERFNSTKLEKTQFAELIDYAKQRGLDVVSTPFDNESLTWFDEMNIDVVKVASCSVDDWPLLFGVRSLGKKTVISTAGASIDHLKKVYTFFKKENVNIAFMHCVGEYPTPSEHSNLNRILLLKETFPDVEIGFSTHESPLDDTKCDYAVAMGCTIIEKHVGVETEDIKLNAYSCTPDQMETVINKVKSLDECRNGVGVNEKDTLRDLKRGVYLKVDKKEGDVIGIDDVYFAMPIQDYQYDASHVCGEWGWVRRVDNLIGTVLTKDKKKKDPILEGDVHFVKTDNPAIQNIKQKTNLILNKSNVTITKKDSVEISCHYGIENFGETGAVIIDKVNREYCKKIIVVLPGQNHPTHYHKVKEECFELLYGDCTLILNNKKIKLQRGLPILIARGVAHSFSSKDGCVIEEVSTTHVVGDSVYDDVNINNLPIEQRKIKVKLHD